MAKYFKNVNESGEILVGQNADLNESTVICDGKATDGKIAASAVIPEANISAVKNMQYAQALEILEPMVKKFTPCAIAGKEPAKLVKF